MAVKIGVDLDGVVANFVGGWTAELSATFDWDITEEEVQDWDFLPLTPFARWLDFWDWAEARRIFRHLPVYPGAVAGVRKLVMLGDVRFITSRPQWAKQDTNHWLQDLEIYLPAVFDKAKWAQHQHLYVEDSPHLLKSLRAYTPTAKVIRFVRPWNDPVEGVVDAMNWDEVVALATQMIKGE